MTRLALAGIVVLASACGRASSPADSIALGGAAKACPAGATWDGIECAAPHSSATTTGADGETTAHDVVAAGAGSSIEEDTCEGDDCVAPSTPVSVAAAEAMLMANGIAAYNAHDYPKARKELYTLIQRYPNGVHVADAYFWFGKMFEDEGASDPSKYALAIQAFEETQKYPRATQAPASLLEMGIVYGRMHETGKQKAAFANLRRRYPNSAAASKIPAGF